MSASKFDRATAHDLGWRQSRPGAVSTDDPRVFETMRSHVDAQGDADLPRLRRLEAKLADLGWEMPPERRAFVYDSAASRSASAEGSFARLVATFPEGSTVRAELEKRMAARAAPIDREAERRRQTAAFEAAERRAP